MSTFLNMGGYALFVWGSYAIVLVILLINYILPQRQHKKLCAQLRAASERQNTNDTHS